MSINQKNIHVKGVGKYTHLITNIFRTIRDIVEKLPWEKA